MTFEVVVGGGLVLILGGLIVWGLASLKDHGRDEERGQIADEEVRDANARTEVAAKSPADRREASAILRARLERAARRLRARSGDRSE